MEIKARGMGSKPDANMVHIQVSIELSKEFGVRVSHTWVDGDVLHIKFTDPSEDDLKKVDEILSDYKLIRVKE